MRQALTGPSITVWRSRIRPDNKTLAEKYPDEFIFLEEDPYGAVTYQIPKKYVTVRPPYNEEKRQKQIHDAQAGRLLFVKRTEQEENNA